MGPNAQASEQRLQAEVIPRVEAWETSSGAELAPKKTVFIHFSRTWRRIQNAGGLLIREVTVVASPQVKVLGVIMDQQLRYHAHAGRMAKKMPRRGTSAEEAKGVAASHDRAIEDILADVRVSEDSKV